MEVGKELVPGGSISVGSADRCTCPGISEDRITQICDLVVISAKRVRTLWGEEVDVVNHLRQRMRRRFKAILDHEFVDSERLER